MNNNLKELIGKVKEKDTETYKMLMSDVEFLSKERIKLVGNALRSSLGRTTKEFDQAKVISIMEKIRELSKDYNVEFNIPDNWEGIEKLLRLSILEDVQNEFENQN